MFGGKRDDGLRLLPLKSVHNDPENNQARRRRLHPEDVLSTDVDSGGGRRFVNSYEWKVTKSTSACLFRTLGRYYDELWFPTVIREWCMLFYQCNYAEMDNYWWYRDKWLAGDEEVRMAMWSEISRYRGKYSGYRGERAKTLQRNEVQGNVAGCDPDDVDRVTDVDADDNYAEAMGMLELVDEANDLIKLKRLDVEDVVCKSPAQQTEVERMRVEAEAAEIAMADPNDDPDWLEMRGRMRGSLSALNLARCMVSSELLDHIMMELCKYWANAESVEHEIDPLLERNIVREIQQFRFKLFNVAVDIEPEMLNESSFAETPQQAPEQDISQAPPLASDALPQTQPQLPHKNKRSKKLGNGDCGDIVKTTEQGTVSFQFQNGIAVDATLDGSIRVVNRPANAVAAINANGDVSAIMHPVGFMYGTDDAINVQVNDRRFGNHKLAQIRSTGIRFKATNGPLVYLVDEAGVRTNFSEHFMHIEHDVTLDILYKDCRHGSMYVDVCNELLPDIKSKMSNTSTEWKFNDMVIVKENVQGFVRVIKEVPVKYEICTSSIVGTINLYSEGVYCTASHGLNHHFFVRKNKSRIHYEANNKFMVRFGGYHTGFNEIDKVSFF